jgi:serine phosphatase RsbU (regulator of sigma subunit)
MHVGGDLYDVVPGGDTNADACDVVVADVCGKGAEAAALTALIRHTVRAEIDHGLGPAAVLERLNRAMLHASGGRPGRFATVAHARLSRTPKGAEVRLASAGHPPPLLVRDGRATPVPVSGTLLGIYPDVTLTEVTFDLHHGEIMVLYTDGVTEARCSEGLYGTERLACAVASAPGGTADAIADHILADVDAFQCGQQRDDIAILVVEAVESVEVPG